MSASTALDLVGKDSLIGLMISAICEKSGHSDTNPCICNFKATVNIQRIFEIKLLIHSSIHLCIHPLNIP